MNTTVVSKVSCWPIGPSSKSSFSSRQNVLRPISHDPCQTYTHHRFHLAPDVLCVFSPATHQFPSPGPLCTTAASVRPCLHICLELRRRVPQALQLCWSLLATDALGSRCTLLPVPADKIALQKRKIKPPWVSKITSSAIFLIMLPVVVTPKWVFVDFATAWDLVRRFVF